MSKSATKALEENSALRREVRELKGRCAMLQARVDELLAERTIHANGNLHQ